LSTVLDAQRYARQLKCTVLFHGVSEDRIRGWLLASDVRVCEYENGEYLFTRSDTSERLGILLRGSAEVNRESDDGMMHMSTLKRNDLFGAASLFGERSYVTDIRCIDRARVLLIGKETLLDLLSANRTVLENYLAYLNSRIRFLNRRLDALSQNTVAGRVYTFLSDEAQNSVVRVGSMTKLSKALCVSRATLYRALDSLEETNKIRRSGKEIILSEDKEV
jgi:cAMP-binding proteins - catabolite gene activator and regulatory subunit of cAMP-dependent protein kinases